MPKNEKKSKTEREFIRERQKVAVNDIFFVVHGNFLSFTPILLTFGFLVVEWKAKNNGCKITRRFFYALLCLRGGRRLPLFEGLIHREETVPAAVREMEESAGMGRDRLDAGDGAGGLCESGA
ncbi:MAG: hypothetical protein J5477_04890 [Schwartzia sp.]|nr:hypothetical protein [Schwartzia sp. (in: firmicutes)]